MLRKDDAGLTLNDLIIQCYEMLMDFPKSFFILSKVIRNTDEGLLSSIVYDKEYLISNMRIYDVNDIPRFMQNTPEGVIHPEYDSILEKCFAIDTNEFVSKILKSSRDN